MPAIEHLVIPPNPCETTTLRPNSEDAARSRMDASAAPEPVWSRHRTIKTR